MEEAQKNRIKGINVVYLITILISIIVPFLPLDFIWERPVLQIVFSQVIIALPSVVYMWTRRLPYAETVRLRKMKLFDMMLCILFGILIQPVISLINMLSMVFSKNITGAVMLDITEQLPFLTALLLMAVMPAVLEESVYRGVFYNEYSKHNPLKAVLLSGLLFGIMHGNINQFCYAAVMGIVFALLVEATGSVVSTMLVHFWTNAGSVVMLYLYPKMYEVARSFYNMYVEYENVTMAAQIEAIFGDMSMSAADWVRQMMNAAASMEFSVPEVLRLYGLQAVVMGTLAFFVYRKLARRNGSWERICSIFQKRPKERIVTIPLVIAIALGIAYMIFYEVAV